MSNVFTNLAAQTLSSRMEIQPLIPPLFAPAPQLVSEAALPSLRDQPAATAETAPFSIVSSMFADEMTGTSEIEYRSKEIVSLEKRPILSDLVPPDIQQDPISTLSLHRLLHPLHTTHRAMETASSTSPASAPVPTSDESSLEDTHAPTSPYGTVDEASRSGAHLSPSPLSSIDRPTQTKVTTPADTIPDAPEITSSFVFPDETKQMAEKSFHAVPTKRESQHTSRENYPVTAEGETSLVQIVPLTAGGPAAPLPIQPAPPASLPSLQSPAQPESTVKPVDLQKEKHSLSLVHPSLEPTISQPHRSRLIVPTVDVSVQPATVSPVIPSMTHIGQETLDLPPGSRFSAPPNSVEQGRASINSSAPTAPGKPYAPPVPPVQQVAIEKEESELPPIRITIGRVVVRATPAAQPTPSQKRVLRPAQSLKEYLKQREKGSR